MQWAAIIHLKKIIAGISEYLNKDKDVFFSIFGKKKIISIMKFLKHKFIRIILK